MRGGLFHLGRPAWQPMPSPPAGFWGAPGGSARAFAADDLGLVGRVVVLAGISGLIVGHRSQASS
jgi:hypothetical protein